MDMPRNGRELRSNGQDLGLAVIGAGNMGRALARRLADGGYTVLLASRDLEKARHVAEEVRSLGRGIVEVLPTQQAAVRAAMVVLATPYRESTALAVELSDVLGGKVVIDIANPLNATYDALVTDPETSAAEEIQRRLPGAVVVKAFNTNFAGPLFEGHVGGHPLDVFLAADDADAKAAVDTLVRGCGLRPLDAGALANARILERMALLCIELQFKHGLQFQSALQFQPRRFDPPARVATAQKRPREVHHGRSIDDQLDEMRASIAALETRLESLISSLGHLVQTFGHELQSGPRPRQTGNRTAE